MIIALDYDLTFTANPSLFVAFLQHAHSYHKKTKIIMVTYRNETIDQIDRRATWPYLPDFVKIIYTSGKAKRDYLRVYHPLYSDVAVWIDDNPESIISDSDMSPLELIEWRR